jgi:hypothetical protein
MRARFAHSGVSVYFRRHSAKIKAKYIRHHCIVEQLAAFGGSHSASSGGLSVLSSFCISSGLNLRSAQSHPGGRGRSKRRFGGRIRDLAHSLLLDPRQNGNWPQF